MTAGDLEFAAGLTGREGWASGRSDFELHMAHDPNGCFVAWESGARLGMVTTTCYPASGWISNLIVVPEHRSRGVGRLLMEYGLRRIEAAGVRTVRLDGDPPGIPLYRSLGFVDEWPSLRFRRAGGRVGRSPQIEDLEPDDLAAVAAFDRAVFGDDRARVLRLLFDRAERAVAVRERGELSGYAIVVRTDRGLRLGPCVAVDAVAAERLVRAATGVAAEGEGLTVGVPGPNTAAQEILGRLGFESTAPSLRMVRGPAAAAGRPDHIFAIANGAVG